MELTIDHIASEIMCWCAKDSNSFKNYLNVQDGWERKALEDIKNLFNKQSGKLMVKDYEPVYNSTDKVDLYFNPNTLNPEKRILAEVICEAAESTEKYNKKIGYEIKKLDKENLKDEYKDATKYLISMYHNLYNRSFLHENNFIEIFNNMEIGCAIKRIK